MFITRFYSGLPNPVTKESFNPFRKGTAGISDTPG